MKVIKITPDEVEVKMSVQDVMNIAEITNIAITEIEVIGRPDECVIETRDFFEGLYETRFVESALSV